MDLQVPAMTVYAIRRAGNASASQSPIWIMFCELYIVWLVMNCFRGSSSGRNARYP